MPFFAATVERDPLAKAIAQIQRIVDKRNTIPILSNFLIEAREGALAFRATDLDIEATVSVQAAIQAEGALTVSAHLFGDIVRKMDGTQITLTAGAEGDLLAIKCGRSRFNLQTLPAQDFPELADAKYQAQFTLTGAALARLLESGFARSNEETRYYLNGVHLHSLNVGNTLYLRGVATDGHRLARVETESPEVAAGMPPIILPAKAVGELLKLAKADEKESVAVAVSPSIARFQIGGVTLTTKLIDGTFPDYQRVIPTGNDKRLIVDKTLLASAIDRIATLTSERGRAMRFAIEGRQLTLSVNNPDSGSATEEIEADYDSEPMEIGFNAGYLSTILDQIDGEKAEIRLADAGSPALISDHGRSESLYVLMPLRI